MNMNSDQWTELIKFFGVLATAATVIFGAINAYASIQKSKSSIDPQLSQSMVANIERDSHVRREFMEAMKDTNEISTRILERLADSSVKITENYHAGRQKTEELHALTRKEIFGLGNRLDGKLEKITENQTSLIKLVGPISEKFKKDAA